MAIDPAHAERLTQAFFFFDEEDSGGEDRSLSTVRVIDVEGFLVYRDSWYWCSYEGFLHEMQEAFDDSTCEAIVIRITSAGGLVMGMTETVRKLRTAKLAAGKPVLAFADELMCSAGYGLGCVADEIGASASAIVGSVGTVMAVYDQTEANKKMGLRVELITSGESKTDGHPDAPLTGAALKRLRERVAVQNSLFVDLVADARRTTPEAILALDAGVFVGAKAVEVGLVDRLTTLEETIAEAGRRGAAAALARTAPRPLAALSAHTPQPEENTMKTLLEKFGLPSTATEAEALAALAALTDAQRELLATTGKATQAEAIGTVRGWSKTAAAHAELVARVEADKAAARTAAVEAIFKAAIETGRRTPAEVDAARKSIAAGTLSLDTDEKVAAYKAELEASPPRLPGASVAGGPLAPSSDGALVGASWEQMSTEAKHRLYNENPAAYQTLKAAHQQQQKKR